ncbi:MAG: hypothetical protein LBV08_00740, partial [Clostridiales bacterium]|nr:hypothetical protein [Clostridiales bacterium]
IIDSVIKTVIGIILAPVKLFLKLLSIPAKFIGRKISIIGNKFKKTLKKIKFYAKMKVRGIVNDLKIIIKKI